MSPKYSNLRPIWSFTFFCVGPWWENIFIVIFAYFSHKTSNLMKKNTQKYILNVKFPVESNPAGRISLNSEEKPKKNAKKMQKRTFY